MNVCAKQIVFAILTFLLFGLSGCVEDNAGSDGWRVDENNGTDVESDAGHDTSSDARSDASTTCEDIDMESACTPREECAWGAISCDADGSPTMGCYTGSLAGAIDCQACSELTNAEMCEARAECMWHQQICDGEVTDERCLPAGALPERTCPIDNPDECEGRGPAECRSIDGCAAIYSAQCPNMEVPEGVVAYDEFKCLPHVAQHGDAPCEPGLSDCPDGYACGQVWAGCPPDADCFVCASAAEVCLPNDAP